MLHLNKIQKEDHLYAAFSYFDKDGSGYITQDELQQACEQFGLGDAHLEDIIREVDQDNVNGFLPVVISVSFSLGHKIVNRIWYDILFILFRMGALITVNL